MKTCGKPARYFGGIAGATADAKRGELYPFCEECAGPSPGGKQFWSARPAEKGETCKVAK